MSDAPPIRLSDDEVQRHFPGGPSVRKAQLVLISDGIYKRESDGWRLLDDRAHASVDDMIEAQRGS